MTKKYAFLFFVSAITATTLAAVSDSNSNYWSEKMMNLVNPVIRIYSIDLNKETFDPKEKEVLLNAVKDLKTTSHGLRFSFINFFSSKDPAVRAEFREFKHNLDMAEKTMDHSTKQSVFYIRSAIGQCASCHSKGGKSTHLFDLFKDTKLPLTDKGRLALAIRDYDASAKIFKSIMLDPSLQDNYFKMNDVLVSYLNSAILSHYNNAQIVDDLKAVQKTTTNKGTQNDLSFIIKDIEGSKKLETFNQAMEKFKTYSKDLKHIEHSTFTTLKIKNVLHESLSHLDKNQKLQAYEALGDIYSYFPEISIFMVPENYYELCVRTQPKSDTAKSCFEKYKSKIVLGYSGSMGTSIPEYEKAKIESLKKLTSM